MRRKSVFLVHGYETATGRHSVSFGNNFNNPNNTRTFSKLSDAKKFAKNKAIQQGNNKYLADLPSGSKDILVTSSRKTQPSKKPQVSIFGVPSGGFFGIPPPRTKPRSKNPFGF